MDDKQKKSGKNNNEMMAAFREILDKYRNISISDVEMFTAVYYPIAIIEMNIDEKTFEDFETVQLTVLRLYSLGQTSHEAIADLMGLSPNYVFKILRLLHGYGFIDDSGVTAMGKDSLAAGKKIIESPVLQKFQVDALNGDLIKVNRIIADNTLNSKDSTNFYIGHLDYMDGISVNSINEQLKGQNYNSYIKSGENVLNRNIISINDVKCVEVDYAKCYMMKFNREDKPVIFSKRYDSSKIERTERFSWLPLSLPDEIIRNKYSFEEELPLNSPTADTYVTNVYNLIKQKNERLDYDSICMSLQRMYPFDMKKVTVSSRDSNGRILAEITAGSFTVFRKWVFQFLLDIYKHGQYLYSNEYLYGKILVIKPNDMVLAKACELCNDKVMAYGKDKVFEKLKEEMRSIRGRNIIEGILNMLEHEDFK